MTVIDLVIITFSAYSILVIYKNREGIIQSRSSWPVFFVVAAMCLLGFFYLTDLLAMWVLPFFIGEGPAMGFMRDLHLNYSWINNLFISICIFYGLTFTVKKLLEYSHELKDANRQLNDQYEQKIQALEELEKLRVVVESSNVAVLITDDQGYIEYANPAFAANYGYSPSEVICQSIDLIKFYDITQVSQENIKKIIRSNKFWSGNLPHKKKDGNLIWSRTYISSVNDNNNDLSKFVYLLEDVTHELQEAIR